MGTVIPTDLAEAKAFWKARWLSEGTPGWHRGILSPELTHLADFTNKRVLVPLCGMSLDLHHLAERAAEVVGIEWVESAAEGAFGLNNLQPRRSQTALGPLFEAENLKILSADILEVTPVHVGVFDLIFDRAALIALPPNQRVAYAARLANLVSPGGQALIVTVEYDQSAAHGPPHCVPATEIEELFENCFIIKHINTCATHQMPQRFEGLQVKRTVWSLGRRPRPV